MAAEPARINGVPIASSIPLKGLQRTVSQRMMESRQSTASVTAMAEIDAGALLEAVRRMRDNVPELSLTHLLISATAQCLLRHPRLNATLVDDTIHELAEVNISVALSLPSDDLLAVTIRQADTKTLGAIAAELRTLRQRAESGKPSLNDVRGGTFTLSNYGALRSVLWATPIIMPGQVGILGVGRVIPRPVWVPAEERWSMQQVLPMSLTYDHRVVNGVPAGRFLDDLATVLATESWSSEEAGGEP